jgi:predicted aminopeptidase
MSLVAIYMIHHVAKYYLENEHRLSEVWYTPVELNETNPWKIRSWNQIKNDPSLDKRLNTEEPKMQQIRADIVSKTKMFANERI